MTAIYTFDVFCSLDGFGSYGEGGDWGGYWGKQGPEFLARRRAQYEQEQRMVLNATGPGTLRFVPPLVMGSVYGRYGTYAAGLLLLAVVATATLALALVLVRAVRRTQPVPA